MKSNYSQVSLKLLNAYDDLLNEIVRRGTDHEEAVKMMRAPVEGDDCTEIYEVLSDLSKRKVTNMIKRVYAGNDEHDKISKAVENHTLDKLNIQ